MSEIKVLVLKPKGKTIIVIGPDRRLLLVANTFVKAVEPGEYSREEDIVGLFTVLSTKNHEPVRSIRNTKLAFEEIRAILEADIPDYEKLDQIKHVLKKLRRRGY